MHINSILLFKKYASQLFKDNISVLEIGPDQIPSSYKKLIDNHTIKWDTLDIKVREGLTYNAIDEYSFPIKKNCYDIVLSGQVIEHIRKPWIWIKEVSRICKVGGYIITINPVSWPYHRAPFDCWRILPDGMKVLYEEAGIVVILSLFESLEFIELQKKGFKKVVFGKSPPSIAFMTFLEFFKGMKINYMNPKWFIRYLLFLLIKKIGWPISCSIDTITIGKKEF